MTIYVALVLIPALPLLLTWGRLLTRRNSLSASSPVTVELPLLIHDRKLFAFFHNFAVRAYHRRSLQRRQIRNDSGGLSHISCYGHSVSCG